MTEGLGRSTRMVELFPWTFPRYVYPFGLVRQRIHTSCMELLLVQCRWNSYFPYRLGVGQVGDYWIDACGMRLRQCVEVAETLELKVC